jgi:hypothetical protein
MKHKFIIAIIALLLVFGGCAEAEIEEVETLAPGVQVESLNEVEEVQEDIFYEEEGEEEPDNGEIEEEIIPTLQPSDIGMTEEEIYALAMQRADELQRLFLDFLQHELKYLKFSIDKENPVDSTLTLEDGSEHIVPFYLTSHDTIKTYDHLYEIFNKTCTPELSTWLLKHSSHYYTDIDGQLGLFETMRTHPLNCDEVRLDSFVILNYNKIRLDFTADLYWLNDTNGYITKVDFPFDGYSILLEYIDGEWFISDCSGVNGICTHGYHWNMST